MLVFTDFSQGLKLAKRTLILILGFKFLSNCIPRHHRVKWDREQQSCFLPKFIWPLMGPGSLVLSRSLGLTQEQHQTHCFEKQRQMFFKAPDWEKTTRFLKSLWQEQSTAADSEAGSAWGEFSQMQIQRCSVSRAKKQRNPSCPGGFLSIDSTRSLPSTSSNFQELWSST